jgi:hypothetical protein
MAEKIGRLVDDAIIFDGFDVIWLFDLQPEWDDAGIWFNEWRGTFFDEAYDEAIEAGADEEAARDAGYEAQDEAHKEIEERYLETLQDIATYVFHELGFDANVRFNWRNLDPRWFEVKLTSDDIVEMVWRIGNHVGLRKYELPYETDLNTSEEMWDWVYDYVSQKYQMRYNDVFGTKRDFERDLSAALGA